MDQENSFPPVEPNDRLVLDAWIEMAKRMRPVVFVGAGFSLNAEPKPGWREHMASWTLSSTPRCLLWHELLGVMRSEMSADDARETDFLRLAQYYRETHGLLRLQAVLRDAVPDHLLIPGIPHLKLTETRWEAILTTNYDTLIQKAFRAVKGRGDVHVIYRDQDLARPRLPGTTCELIHLHGILEEASSLVLTWDDYRQYAESHPGLLTRVRQLFTQHPVLIVGFSLNDPNFYAINGWVGDLLKRAGRPPVLCVQDSPSSDARRAHWRDQGIQFVTLKLSGEMDRASAIGPAYAELLGYIASRMRGTENLRDQVSDPVLAEKHFKRAVMAAQNVREALNTVERLLAVLPKTRSTSDTRQDAWFSFSDALVQEHSDGRSFAKGQAIGDASATDQASAPNVGPPSDPVQVVLSRINDDKVAARWLFLGVVNLGIEVDIKGERNLLHYLDRPEYKNQISYSEWTDVLLAQYAYTLEHEDEKAADLVRAQVLQRRPGESIRGRIELLTEIQRFRNGGAVPTPGSIFAGVRSPQVLNFYGSLSLWSNDPKAAQQYYEQARELARENHDLLTEWVALQGLLYVSYADIFERDESLEEEVRPRLVSLEREPDVARVNRASMAIYRDGQRSLAEGVESELLQAKRGNAGRSMRSSDFTRLWNLLLDEEELGLPPARCKNTAELLGSLLVRQGGNLVLATNLLLRYGSSKLVTLFEIYPPARYLNAQDWRRLTRLVLSPGRSSAEWVLKLQILRQLLLELPADALKDATEFLEASMRWIEVELQRYNTNQIRSIGGFAAWAALERFCAAVYAVARCRDDGPALILRMLESSVVDVRRAAVSTFSDIGWGELQALGRLESNIQERIALALGNFVQLDLDVGDPAEVRSLLDAVNEFLDAVGESSRVHGRLDESILKLVRALPNTVGTFDRSYFVGHLLGTLSRLRSSEARGLLVEQAHLEMDRLSRIANPQGWASQVFPVSVAVPFLDEAAQRKLLERALEVAVLLHVGDDGAPGLAYLSAQILKKGSEALLSPARELLNMVVMQHPNAAVIAADVKRETLGLVTAKLDLFVEDLINGRNVAEDVQPAPWQSGLRKGWLWDQSILGALRALMKSFRVNHSAPSSWLNGLESLARNPQADIAHAAISAIGESMVNGCAALAVPRFLQVLRDGIHHTAPRVRYVAAYWLGRSGFDVSFTPEGLGLSADEGMSIGLVYSHRLGQAEAGGGMSSSTVR